MPSPLVPLFWPYTPAEKPPGDVETTTPMTALAKESLRRRCALHAGIGARGTIVLADDSNCRVAGGVNRAHSRILPASTPKPLGLYPYTPAPLGVVP